MKKQFVVIGLGRFGSSVARTLSAEGHDVLAIDVRENAVQAIMNDVTHAVQADAREEENLKALGVRNFDVAVVAIGDDLQANILITLMLKEMGIRYVVAKAQTNLHGRVLEKVGADKIIYPEKDMGVRVAHNLVTSNIMDYIALSPDYSIAEIVTPRKFIGKTLGELDLRAKYHISVMAIRNGDKVNVAPGSEASIQENDILVVVSKNKDIEKLPE
ncbi:TrkA family potassium uptake protein [Desulfitobacterium sp.]|uniref:potassium channel family protein n=1 Tax=Desulfitobacterium sp. TaxID=49981 RepID=UPI002B212D74|nr:TrkA family potassium uptake protein [Desulfitobacterium sp.]MEA4901775.1 TrkA family potassium uptake protein [Desulfitobacterium sp.]